MAEIIDIDIHIGESTLFSYPLPCVIYTRTPYISWTLPLERTETEITVTNTYVYNSTSGWVNTISGRPNLYVPTDKVLSRCNLDLHYDSNFDGWYSVAYNNLSGKNNNLSYTFNGENWVIQGGTSILPTSEIITYTYGSEDFLYEYVEDVGWITKYTPKNDDRGTVTNTEIEVTYDRLNQVRFNCRIRAIDGNANFINGSMSSSNTYFQWPTSNPMTDNFIGLCSIEVLISSVSSGEYEYSSGVKYFVFDTNAEIISRRSSFIVGWSNSNDAEQSWDELKYNLIVATNPTFSGDSVFFDEMVSPSNRLSTYQTVNIPIQSNFYFYKVRAFDGFDYSEFTPVNAFMMIDNRAPTITIHKITVTGNEESDVIIDFSVDDPDSDVMSVKVFYFGGTGDGASETGAVAFMVTPLIAINSGRHTAIWRSSMNEKRISGNYYIYMVVSDVYGIAADATSTTFFLDNTDVGVTPSTPNNLSYNFRFLGRMGIKQLHYMPDELFRNIGYFANTYLPYKNLIPRYKGYNSTWSTYICDFLESIKEQNSININIGDIDLKNLVLYPSIKNHGYQTIVYPSEDGLRISGVKLKTRIDNRFEYKLYIRSSNYNTVYKTIVIEKYDEENETVYLRESIKSYYPYSSNYYMFEIIGKSIYNISNGSYKSFFRLPLGTSAPKEEDLDKPYDFTFVTDIEHVNADGEYQKIETNPQKVFSDYSKYRKGYIRLIKNICAYQSDICKKCGGKGWNKEELVEDTSIEGPYRFKRVPCSECRGHRFYHQERENNSTVEYIKIFWVSDYRPLKGYLCPDSFINGISACRYVGKTREAPSYQDYIIGAAVPNSPSEYKKHQIVAKTMRNKAYNIDGFFDGFSFNGYYGKKKTNSLPKIKYRYVGKMLKDPYEQEYLYRYIGNLFSNKKKYIPGVWQEEEVFNFMREIPTWKYEAGMICFNGNVTTYHIASDPLEIIYLQDTWSEYNTIHWNGEISSNTTYHVQYKEVRGSGEIDDVWHDVIPENGFYDETRNVWLVNPNQRHCFWHTINQIPFNTEKSYYIQIEQYNILSGTFTGSVISRTSFRFGENETNPANIYHVEYKSLSKELYIYFRIDDPSNDTYDIVDVAYSPNGETFYPISSSHISGYTNQLSSYKKTNNGQAMQPNEHLIVWDTVSYNLEPGDDYRIRIKVIKSKYVMGYSLPVLSWRKDPNTFLDENKHSVEEIEGVWQYYAYDDENNEVIRLETPFFVEGKYHEIKNKIEEIKRQNYPLPDGNYGYYSFLNSIEVDSDSSIIVLDGAIKDSIEINGENYKYFDWMSEKDSDGYSRNDKLYMLSNEFDELTDRLIYLKDSIDSDKKYTRKLLIDQGYYCNGYKFNKSENGKFEFKVLLYFDNYLDENGKYVKPYNEYFGDIIYQYDTIEQDELLDEPITITTYIHEYDRTAEVYNRIQLDQNNKFNSQNGKPMRDFIISNGDRIISLAGGEDYLKRNMAIINENNPPETSYEQESVDRYKNVKEKFSIPEEYLPGKQEGDITLWSDDDGSETFDGSYYWRVSSYNIIRSSFNEKPFVDSQSFTYESNNRIFLNLFVKADEDIKNFDIMDIKYFNQYNSSYSIYNLQEVCFGTDVSDSDISSGDTYDFTWLPMTKDRTRPIVIIDKDHRYNMWYSRSDDYDHKIIVYAKGRCENIFGDYDTAIPSDNKPITEELEGINNVFSPYVFYQNNMYYMYYTISNSNGTSIHTGTSNDGIYWYKNPIVGIGGSIYNPFARYKNNQVELYYCKYIDGLSKVYKSLSSDGITFSGESLFFECENNISSIFILEHDNNDVIFYSESYEESDSNSETNYHYRINNNSNGIFPIIDNASNFYCYKSGFDYVFYYDFNNKIYSGRMRNYTLKEIANINFQTEYGYIISGLMRNIPVTKNGVNRTLVINRNSMRTQYDYFCNNDFRNSNNIIGFIIDMKSSANYKEYRIESPFLSSDNVGNTNGELDPMIYRYIEV